MTTSDPMQPYEPIQSPLDLSTVPQILYGNCNTTPRHQSTAEARVVGAVLGGMFGAWLSGRKARKARELQELKDRLGVGNVE